MNPVRRLRAGVPLLALTSLLTISTALATPIYHQDFNGTTSPWPGIRSYKRDLNTSLTPTIFATAGTIDTYSTGTGTPSKALRMVFNVNANAAAGWWLGAGSGFGPASLLPSSTPETTINRLNLSFDLRASQARTLRVRIASYTDATTPVKTGESDFLLTPPIANAYLRYTFDLNQAQAGGNFNPASGRMEISVNVNDSDGNAKWTKGIVQAIELDNVNLSRPTYYVDSSYTGSVRNGAFTTPFISPQAALDTVVGLPSGGAGSVIMIRAGNGYKNTADFGWSYNLNIGGDETKPPTIGSPSRWIVIRNYPGDRPVFNATNFGRGNIRISARAAYLEIRGLEIKGRRTSYVFDDADAAQTQQRPEFNSAGIMLDAKHKFFEPHNILADPGQIAHHISIRDNVIYDNTFSGFSSERADYLYVEDNHIYDNMYWSNNAGSGLSFFRSANFHLGRGANDYRIFALRNEVHGNQSFIRWYRTDDTVADYLSDGNGIIVDQFTIVGYTGRTLIQNNTSYLNGGSGIHAYFSDNVVIANNTTYSNSQRLDYGEIFANQVNAGVEITNNIMVAAAGKRYTSNYLATNLTYRNNLFWRVGSTSTVIPPASLTNGVTDGASSNTWGNPNFLDATNGIFTLPSGTGASPAKNTGNAALRGAAPIDQDLRFRPDGTGGLDRGAFEAP